MSNMSYTSHYETEEYPFHGVFYRVGIDDSKPLDEQEDEKILIFETILDMGNGTSLSTETFRVYFPFDAERETLVIAEGNLFEGEIYGMTQRGRVIGIYPSQLGGCMVLLTRV